MKNLKIYFSILFISVLTCSILFACSSDDNQSQQSTSSVNSSNSTKKSASITSGTITCYISGSTVSNVNTNNAYSSVPVGSTTTYQYNSSPSVSNVVWSIVPGTVNPSGSLIISGSGSTASVTVSSNFLSGSIQAVGTDSTGQICGPILPIVKSSGGGIACCTPILSASFICRGSGSGSIGGFVEIINPASCSIDWSTISSIDFQLSTGTVFTYSGLYGLNAGTITNPQSLKGIRLPFHHQGCDSEIACIATFHYNNGCPTVTESVVTFGPVETSN